MPPRPQKRKESDSPAPKATPRKVKRPRKGASGTGAAAPGAETATGNSSQRASPPNDDPGDAGPSGVGAGVPGGPTSAPVSDSEPAAAPKKSRGRAARIGIAPKDVEPRAKATKDAFLIHIRAFCGLIAADTVLAPVDDLITHYDKRFDNVDDFPAHMKTIISLSKAHTNEAVRRAKRLRLDSEATAKTGGTIAAGIALIPAQSLELMFTAAAKAGLLEFHPDVFGPVHSTYNMLHRHLAVSTFQHNVAWFSYTLLGPSVTISSDTALMGEIYDHFVHVTLRKLSRGENNTPGRLTSALAQAAATKRRLTLCDRRFEFLESNNFRKPILRLAYVEACHSDDERETIVGENNKKKTVQHARAKEYRNSVVGGFFKHQDQELLKRLERDPDSTRKPLERLYEPLLPESKLSKILPRGVPIDIFKPEYYNQLDVEERALYANNGVAFPLPEHCNVNEMPKWKSMPAKEFMKVYGEEVLKLYNRPSQEELEEYRRMRAEREERAAEGKGPDLEDTEDEDAGAMEQEDAEDV
ncbi:hypothetical protein C8F01DRAFT_1257602 [Mycena amicta]|nr:hypothetical protein C8F01DRAFT_1257602 [Mycena amicta]